MPESAPIGSSPTDIIAPAKATRREWLALLLLVFPTLVVAMDMTVTYLALPVLSAALKPSAVQLLWITDIFGFLEAGLLIVMGSIGDRIGLRKLLLTGASAFTLASVLATFSTSAFWLIVARGVMGIAGASLLPTVISIIRNLFADARQRTFAMGCYTTCFSAGTMLGPVIGGMLLDRFGWQAVFWMPLPLIVLLLLSAPFLMPEFKHAGAAPVDSGSAALLISAILPAVYGLKQLAQMSNAGGTIPGGTSGARDILMPMFFLLAGAVLAWLFLRRQRRIPNPLIQLDLFRDARFNAAIAALFVALFNWSGISLFLGQYLQSVAGLDSFTAGLWLLPGAVGSIGFCMLAPVLARYFHRVKLIAAGLVISGIGAGALCFLGSSSLVLLAVAYPLISGGGGLAVTLGIDWVVASAPPEKAGAAAGLSETSTGFGSSFGIAILGSIGMAVYHHDPASIHLAPRAFVQGIRVTAAVASAIALITAIRLFLLIFKEHKNQP